MQVTKLLTTVFDLIQQSPTPTVPKLPQLTPIIHPTAFHHQTTTNITTHSPLHHHPQPQPQPQPHHTNPTTTTNVTNMTILKQLIRVYWRTFVIALVVNVLAMLILVLQPFVNNYIKGRIYGKFQGQLGWLVLECVGVYVGYKVVASLFYVLADFWGMVFGVKMYSATSYKLIGSALTDEDQRQSLHGNLVACLQDDCQRLQNIPASSINSMSKTTQFLIFSSLLLSKLPNYTPTIALSYWLFLILTICLALYSSKLNLKIMQSKQQRIQYTTICGGGDGDGDGVGVGVRGRIEEERKKEIGMIRELMVVDGVGLILPWVVNVGFLIVICGYVGVEKDDRYVVLTVFGLLRASISGLGTNMNYFAQAWSSLQRISNYINQLTNKSPLTQPLTHPQPHPNHPPTSPSHPTLLHLLKTAKKSLPNRPILIPLLLLSSLLFTSNFMYSYCAKSILIGESIFSFFNILTLVLELVAPVLLYWFVCWCNLGISRDVYRRLLEGKGEGQLGLGVQDINRLSGDIRLLDRQLYFCTYGTISHLTGIAASFLYSIVILNNVFSSIILTLIICLSAWIAYLCRKFITLRKECYRKQATNKGKLLKCLSSNQNPTKKWKNIYTYKIFGFGIELTFISILYTVMIVISTVILVVVLVSSAGAEESSILIMLISQLDSQFLVLFVQVMMLQTCVAAVSRCFAVVGQPKHSNSMREGGQTEQTILKSGQSSNEEPQAYSDNT